MSRSMVGRAGRTHVSGRRVSAAAAIVALLSLVVGCGATDAVVYRLAEYVEDAPLLTGSVMLLPSGEERGAGRLAEGWSSGEPGWIEGRVARAHFALPEARATRLTLELRPYAPPGAPPQTLRVQINGEELWSGQLRARWARLEIPVPRRVVERGGNELLLMLGHALVPSEEEPGSDDLRELAARVRLLVIGDLPPPELRSVGVVPGDDGAPILLGPDGAVSEIWIQVPDSAVLQGSVAVGGASGQASRSSSLGSAVIELEDSEGRWQPLLDVALDARPSGFEVDLAPWAGQIVRLWLRGRSDPTGFVAWHDPVVRAPSSSVPAASLALQEPETAAGAELDRPDVFVVVLDAARADAFAPYGADRPTPAVERLAADGTVFASAYSSSPWTGEAIPSVFTGRYPEAHGVDAWGRQLPESVPTMAEVVGRLGYHTVLWSQHTVYGGNRSLRRGFDRVIDALPGTADVVPDRAELFLDGSPTFAVLHWLPPHAPYRPPEPFRGRYTQPVPDGITANVTFLNRFPHHADPASLSARHLRYIRDRYDENVAYADDLVGRFLEMLRESDRYEDALVVLLSDHGEAFLEHGWFLHTHNLYEEVVRVPFVIKWPRELGEVAPVVATPVSTIQLFATLVDALGVEPGPRIRTTGSLLPLVRDEVDRPPVVYFSTRGSADRNDPPAPLWGFRAGRLKVIYSAPTDRVELYDLVADPGERHDLAPARPRLAAFLLQQANLHRGRNRDQLAAETAQAEDEELSTEMIERLRALGYLQ